MSTRHYMIRLILFVIAMGVSAPGIRAQSPDAWHAPYTPALLPEFVHDLDNHADLPRYAIDLRLDVSPDTVRIEGRQTVNYTNRLTHELGTVVFRLYPNLDSYGGALNVNGVTAAGAPVIPTLDDTRTVLTVPLNEPLAPGDQIALALTFDVTLDAGEGPLFGQFSYQDGILALPNAFPLLSVYQPGSGWWQVTDHPQGDAVFSESAFFAVDVTAPANLILAASGSEIDLRLNPDGTLTHRFVAPLMRDFALMGSADYVTITGEQDGVAIRVSYVPDPDDPGVAATAQTGLQITLNALRLFNASFGRYPFSELDVVQTPNRAGGLEYPGLFVIGQDAWDQGDDFFPFVVVHEAAHQWWYSLVGNDQTQEPWIDEALAQYATALYIRDQEGPDAYRAALDSFAAQVDSFLEGAEPPVIGLPVVEYPGMAYFYTVYQRGPLLYAALEDLYGFKAVQTALHDLFTAHRYGMIDSNAILISFEDSLSANLDDLFAEWVGSFPVG